MRSGQFCVQRRGYVYLPDFIIEQIFISLRRVLGILNGHSLRVSSARHLIGYERVDVVNRKCI